MLDCREAANQPWPSGGPLWPEAWRGKGELADRRQVAARLRAPLEPIQYTLGRRFWRTSPVFGKC